LYQSYGWKNYWYLFYYITKQTLEARDKILLEELVDVHFPLVECVDRLAIFS
jgi:hypothetical protein